ncbi:MAG: anhydro-N-acetylmuramic acid kinase [Pseudomonadota bacterium]
MTYIGLMSGTSMDAVDVAVVDVADTVTLKYYFEHPIPHDLRQYVRRIHGDSCLSDVAEIDNKLGNLFADAVNQVIDSNEINREQISAIGSHGQTVFHKPDENKNSIQLGDPNVICAKTGIKTVADFRRMDMAFGGQGAPLAPAFHQFQFQDKKINRAILNIGGIANISLLPKAIDASVIGFDIGPGNCLLDDWNQKHNQTFMDKDSEWAAQGQVIPELLTLLFADPYFLLPYPKSTGRDYFNLNWLSDKLKDFRDIKHEDVQATLLELTTHSIANCIKQYFSECEELLICGGGANNPAITSRLAELLSSISVDTTSKAGIEPDAVEAVTFAWLAYCRVNNISLKLESITGSEKEVLLGGIYN